jgi:hypothetical protein
MKILVVTTPTREKGETLTRFKMYKKIKKDERS